MAQTGKLFFYSGKMAAGKSTHAKRFASTSNTIVISEDEWLACHYPNEINTIADYVKFSSLIKPFVRSHVLELLRIGVTVVMDFPANTIAQRQWFKALIDAANCDHELYFIDKTDQQCLAQLNLRKLQQPERARFDSEEVFNLVGQYFVAPSSEELFNITRITDSQ